jgi:metallo-beta-lactamase class B
MKKLPAVAAALLLAGLATPSPAAPFSAMRQSWAVPQAPFRIIGNIYYVGTHELAAYLIRTPDGDILIDGTLPETASQVEHNIEALGVPLAAVKILLNSHAHYDHAGGLAQLKRDTGARLYASAGDAPILETGHIDFGPTKTDDFPPVHVDRIVKDNERITLGGTVLTAHLTPGHTPGCTSWTIPVTEAGKRHVAIDYCSTTVAGNPLVNNAADPTIVAQYRHSFAVLKTIRADVFLASHASFYDPQEKLAAREAGDANAFVDPDELARFVTASERDFDVELAKQKAEAKD